MISRIIKVEVGVISLSQRPRLTTLNRDLDYSGYLKNQIYQCFFIHWMKQKKVMFSLLHWRQARQSERTWHDYRQKSYTAVTHDMITRDLECPRHDYCIICSYDVTGADLFLPGVNLWKPTCLFHSHCPTCRSSFEDSAQCYFSDHTKKKTPHKIESIV